MPGDSYMHAPNSVSLVLFLLVHLGATHARYKPKFKSWYQENDHIMNTTLHQYCWTEYEYYLTQEPIHNNMSYAASPVVKCLLDHLNSNWLAPMQAAGVLLGILPTALAFVGSSTAEIGMLALRRPFLAFLVATASPVVSPIRSMEYIGPMDLLRIKHGARPAPTLSKCCKFTVCMAQYVFALIAMINIVLVSWQLGVQTVCSWSIETSYHPAIWAFITIAIHLVGAAAIRLRVQVVDARGTNGIGMPVTRREACGRPGLIRRIWHGVRHETTLCMSQTPAIVQLRHETDLFLVLSWMVSTGTVMHIIYGTLTLSATLFLFTQHALGIAGRLLASTLICRVIVAYELAGMRHVVTVKHGNIAA